jgi:cytidine deaminase
MPDLAALQAAARIALRNAHAPYSQLRVGAAVLSTSGATYTGCNVENAAFPAGGCAEHHAIAAAVLAEGPGLVIERVEVAALDPGGNEVNIPPCGGCRQRIKEFGPDAIVGFRGPGGVRVEATLDELLPHGFSF